MKPAFMQLEQMTTSRLLVESLEGHDPNNEDAPTSPTARITGLARSEKDKQYWKVALVIRLRPKKDRSLPPYRLEVDVTGVFSTKTGEVAEPDLARLVGINGASMLYSAVREQVFMVTARGAWGPLQLPTVSFADLKVEPVKSLKKVGAA
jgi:preprotein translocase subunit SecB